MARIEKFDLPFTLDRDALEVACDNEFSPELHGFAECTLIEGFRESESLYAICDFVIHKMKEREGGHWLCNIWPYDIEVGLALNDYVKFLGLDFKRNNLEYRVIIAQTAEDTNTNTPSMFQDLEE